MSGATLEVRGGATAAELAAVLAAVEAVRAAGGAAADPLPAAYRSGWRRAAIDEGVRRGAGTDGPNGPRRTR